ncbi:type VI secretion system lipoprotein TssJ [Halomonas sp. MCCC 1A17488]|uniref:type VI secretion system lipoprotein TssJ n=1 Tax=unclassified Halomonas TaxID=2609666 RepID=UPI0018D2410F|nr:MULTISPECIES: type VI secretion system lipoprotein TssJ [unclassified Halomonas]MCE8017134.1 type VI secretion system lipoprotein TssJ [Halomonas sp. MCCC 1A17488]MCG3240467.1 type VI secretion system lipoprotein TssJ [Halomonas sp. MCCC 1A17488]QPP49674.1 type VI secretion system lipoprotein TssJ [Halomonas sp. SS10-MC5]
MSTRYSSASYVTSQVLQWAVVALLALVLSGCASTREAAGKTWQVMRDPSIPVGYPEDRPSRVDLAMLAAYDVNPNLEGDGTPLRFQVLQLKDDSMLMAADHHQLRDDLEGALGTNYLTHDDFTLLPGQWKFYEPFEVDEQARYIGVIAFYSDPEQAQWKKVVKVSARGEDYHLLVHLRADEAELRKED